MHTQLSVDTTALNFSPLYLNWLRHEAKRLHQAAKSAALAQSLPVLRRLLASQVCRDQSLPELQRNRLQLQRKQLLQLLAIEAGYPGWQAYKQALEQQPDALKLSYDLVRQQAGHLNLWFSNREQAASYVQQHGGTLVEVGQQAMVIPA